jgi:hypothetical protein
MHTALRVACGAIGLAGVPFALTLQDARASTVFLALAFICLACLREAARDENDAPRPAPPPAPTPPPAPPPPANDSLDLVDWIAAREAEQRGHGYRCVELEAPFLVCPRDEVAEVLARHERAIRAHLSAILFLARKQKYFREPLDWMDLTAAEIDLHDGSEPPRLVVRSSVYTARRFRSLLSIHFAAFGNPGARRMRVAVVDEDLVSLHDLELVTEKLPGGGRHRELALLPQTVVFEPVRQELKREGSTWVRTWRATASSPIHEEAVPVPPPAATREEWVARFFAACEPKLRRRLAMAREDGEAMNQILLWLCPGKEFGPSAVVASYTRSGWLEFVERYPLCHGALQRPWPPGWVPVFVTPADSAFSAFAGIEWLQATPNADPRLRPAGVVDVQTSGAARAKRRAQ